MDNIYTRLRVLLHGRRRPATVPRRGGARRITRTGATRSARRRPATVPRRGGAAHHSGTGATRSARRVRNRSDLIVNCGAAGSIRLYPDLSGSIRLYPGRARALLLNIVAVPAPVSK